MWLDKVTDELLDGGGLRRLIEGDGVSGVRSGPASFQRPVDRSRYDDEIRRFSRREHDPRLLYERLAHRDVRDVARLLQPSFQRTRGQDGYVSFELPASLADDAEGTVAAAEHHRRAIDRANVMIAVPATDAGVQAFEELTARGVNVNVTLLFSVARYRQIAGAYMRGLERRVTDGQRIDRSASVASFAGAGLDDRLDAELERLGRAPLRDGFAVANARLAYEAFRRLHSSPRWELLAKHGAMMQRLLWVPTTGTALFDLFVDELIGLHTVAALPEGTLAAARARATPKHTADRNLAAAREATAAARVAGADLDRILSRTLTQEGVEALAASQASLIESLACRLHELAAECSSSLERWQRPAAAATPR